MTNKPFFIPGGIYIRVNKMIYLALEKEGKVWLHLLVRAKGNPIFEQPRLLTSIFCEDFFDERGNKL